MSVFHLDSPQLLYRHLAQHYQMHQIVESNGEYLWQRSEANELSFLSSGNQSSRLPLASPKGLFFSERENIFHFDGECFRETLPTPAPFALFGVHSCDLHAIAYQDQFFAEDPYYQARRQQSLLIGIDCQSPCHNGFCPAVNAGPGVSPDTTDLTLHREANNLWLLIVSSERGDDAVKGLAMNHADKECHQRRDVRIDNCKRQFEDGAHIHTGIAAINQNRVSDDDWQTLAQRCLGCSGCTSLCPTCSCYATRDVEDDSGDNGTVDHKQGVTRQRFWDSCLYESFQREASQHNPSALAGKRVERFWQHKFSNDFADEFGRYGCVGCGRCEQTCPGVIGVHSVMRHISAKHKGQSGYEGNINA